MDVIALRSCLLTLGKRPTLVTNASHGNSGRRTCIKRNLSSTYAISPTTASCAVVAEPALKETCLQHTLSLLPQPAVL